MKTRFALVGGGLIATSVAVVFFSRADTTPASSEPVKRGQYLVERVGVCADCHTERDWKGAFKRDKWLHGSTLEFKPTRMMPSWAPVAPPIAGLPSFATDEQAVKYFETGNNANGKASAPPMPQYRFNREDAEAVVAYLRTLKPPGK